MDEVAAVRAFNRLYTNVIGAVQGMYLDTPYSLTEARLLFELAQREVTAVAELRRALDIDPGYLSRVLSRFEADGLITRTRAGGDARRQDIVLTPGGRAAAADLDARSARQIGSLLDGVDRIRLLDAMRDISSQLGAAAPAGSRAVVLREPRPGDLGWVVHRHGAVYASEFGWDADFEMWVARIAADYLADRGNPRAAGWIADVDGSPAGSILCVPDAGDPGTTARLRVLLVERWARGLGIGGRLVDEVLRFARHAGYARVALSTYDALGSARRIYQAAGFSLVSSEPERVFGQDLTAQEWSLRL
ncbi:MAG: helix-turn-helix domain-containing GNAT family N-acetyltransferase [Streptosporangiales bacterium]|jgi:DNA-binding MarR family transcriptional regulator/GNAT superfamily N-acetyltransferase|nr:helix-turn-helix domain-containing GNAT family N-acetyltransferase [Streptosporangiales bacterium]